MHSLPVTQYLFFLYYTQNIALVVHLPPTIAGSFHMKGMLYPLQHWLQLLALYLETDWLALPLHIWKKHPLCQHMLSRKLNYLLHHRLWKSAASLSLWSESKQYINIFCTRISLYKNSTKTNKTLRRFSTRHRKN